MQALTRPLIAPILECRKDVVLLMPENKPDTVSPCAPPDFDRLPTAPMTGASGEPGWGRLLCRRLAAYRAATEPEERDRSLTEMWVILGTTINAYLRSEGRRFHGFRHEDLEDIAAEKSFELLLALQTGAWDPSSRGSLEIAGYVRSAVRRGFFRRLPTRIHVKETAPSPAQWERILDPDQFHARESAPDLALARADFAQALRLCLQTLAGRARLIWLLRVFCGLASREIATHPGVSLRTGHVDVVLQRVRGRIKDCMRRRGHSSGAIPPGVLSLIWDVLDSAFSSGGRAESDQVNGVDHVVHRPS